MSSLDVARAKVQLIDRQDLASRAQRSLSTLPRPVVRWAGSKQRLLHQLVDVLPAQFGTYFEPFFGSGALFFLLRPTRAVLSDTCLPLVETYTTLASFPDEIHRELASLDPMDRDTYYRVRKSSPETPVGRAARFLFLNRTCWNGLYRVNKKGEFNVPYGSPTPTCLPELELLQSAAEVLSGASVRVSDFESSVETAEEGDLVFLDPPYVTGHNNNGFVDYNEKLFSWADQERLAKLARNLDARGVRVIVTNAQHEAVLRLYKGFTISSTTRASTLAGDKAFRRPVTEALILSRTLRHA